MSLGGEDWWVIYWPKPPVKSFSEINCESFRSVDGYEARLEELGDLAWEHGKLEAPKVSSNWSRGSQ